MTVPSAGTPRHHLHLIDEHEAAQRLDLSVKTLRRWRWSGRGPPFRKLGSAVRYSEEDLAAYVDAACRRSTSDPGTP